jgi:hypothetical protein
VKKPALFVLAASLLSGCSTTPSLEATSGAGPDETRILIADVVRRVKCEIADAFDDKLGDRDYDWLWNWTAKVDLQLQVNETAGAGPSVTYTHYYRNAFNTAAGSELMNSNVIGYVQQTFALTGGATYESQAQRAETVSFTLPLQEVKEWRTAERSGSGAGDVCGAAGRELRGALGLREWVDSALYPVSTSELRAAMRPHTPKPPGPPSVRPRSLSEIEDDARVGLLLLPAQARAQISVALKTADAAYQQTVESAAAVATAQLGAQTAMQTTVAPDLPVLTDTAKRALSGDMAALSVLDEYARDDVEHAREARRELDDIERAAEDAASRDPASGLPAGLPDRAGDVAAAATRFARDAKIKAQKAKQIADGIESFKPNPPIDGLLHSVEFIVTYGGSVSPLWTFLVWKGPGTLPGFSAQAVRTNSLNIALGPTAEQSRLITNQLISNVGTHP